MKEYQLIGLGSGIVDIITRVSDEELSSFNLNKGTMALASSEDQSALLESLTSKDKTLVSGGSVANSIIAFTQLGGKSSFITCLGDDSYGKHYESEFKELNINLPHQLNQDKQTGTSIVLVTPDSERTMQTNLGVSGLLSDVHIEKEHIAKAEWIFLEGYLLASKDFGVNAFFKSIEYAKETGTKIAVTLSDPFIVDGFREDICRAVREADLVFCNEVEVISYAGGRNFEDSLKQLSSDTGHAVVTKGAEGAYASLNGESVFTDAFSCTPVDATGAGDMFAGTYLYSYLNDYDIETCLKSACYLSSKVIQQYGARVDSDLFSYFQEIAKK